MLVRRGELPTLHERVKTMIEAMLSLLRDATREGAPYESPFINAALCQCIIAIETSELPTLDAPEALGVQRAREDVRTCSAFQLGDYIELGIEQGLTGDALVAYVWENMTG